MASQANANAPLGSIMHYLTALLACSGHLETIQLIDPHFFFFDSCKKNPFEMNDNNYVTLHISLNYQPASHFSFLCVSSVAPSFCVLWCCVWLKRFYSTFVNSIISILINPCTQESELPKDHPPQEPLLLLRAQFCPYPHPPHCRCQQSWSGGQKSGE